MDKQKTQKTQKKKKKKRAVDTEGIIITGAGDDTATESEPCARCACPRSSHEIGRGECNCGCVRFVG